MFICIFAEVLNQININIMRDHQTEVNNFNASRIWALEAANEELKRDLEAVKLELRMLKANDPNYDKPLSEINVNYEIVETSVKLDLTRYNCR